MRTTHPLSLAKRKYAQHKAQSKFRNISFNFTFDEWYSWWKSHGVDKNLQSNWTSNFRPCMCRYNDIGPYEISNVYFANYIDNTVDAHKNGKRYNKVYRYKWLNETYHVNEFVSKFNITRQKLHYYLEEHYDKNRMDEYIKLEKQYYKKFPKISYYEYNGISYKTITALSKVLGITPVATGLRAKKKKFGIKKIEVKPDITLDIYILTHSRFPDPILTFN